MSAPVRPLPDTQPLEAALSAGCDPGDLRSTLDHLEEELRGHARSLGREGGLLDEEDRTRPGLGRQEAHLLDGLRDLLRRVGELRRRLDAGESCEMSEDVKVLAGDLRRLRDCEIGLAQESALGNDLGTGE